MAEPLDDYIDAVSKALALPIEEAWRPAVRANLGKKLGIEKELVAVSNTRKISKKSMVHNDATPDLSVDPETYEVRADGELLTCAPAEVLPMAQRYFLY